MEAIVKALWKLFEMLYDPLCKMFPAFKEFVAAVVGILIVGFVIIFIWACISVAIDDYKAKRKKKEEDEKK